MPLLAILSRPRGRHRAGNPARLPVGAGWRSTRWRWFRSGSLVWVALQLARRLAHRRVNVAWVPELSMDITPAVRRARGDHESVLVLGDRRAGALLLRRLLPPPRRAHREAAAQFRRRAGRVLRAPCSALVVSDNMLVLYVFWELTTVLSFLLVGHYAGTRHQPARRHPGVAGDDVRRAGHAGRHHRARQPSSGTYSVVRTDRRTADRAWRHRSVSCWFCSAR